MNLNNEGITAPRLLVSGALRGSAETIPVINPATGASLADAPMASHQDLEDAVSAAKKAGPAWARDEPLRRDTLKRMAAVVAEHRDQLATVLSQETGLTFKTAQDEVGMAAVFLNYRATAATPMDTITDDGKQRVVVVRRPFGVVGAIIPWNAPMMIACEKVGTAFAAGNCVVMKASPLAPLTLLLFGRLVADVVPSGVINVVSGSAQWGEALVAHPDVGMISFTGSTAAGQAIMANAAPGLKRLSLELGGNDAAIVLPDVDIARTAQKLFFGAFYRSGQVCAAIKRLYVHESIHDVLVDALRSVAEQTRLGDPFDPAVTMGPISNRPQFEKFSRIVADSLAAGGKAVTGGKPADGPGFFYPPTLVTGVTASNPLVEQEQFGPALPILPFSTPDEAIASANATSFGLGGSIWSNDIDAALALAGQLQSGSAWVNRHGLVLPDVPFGGMKQSGLGRANGNVGFDSYAEMQTISLALPRA